MCVFCGSNSGTLQSYTAAADALATHLVANDISIVYGGSKAGLMGVLADAALKAGGEVIGIIPQSLVEKEVAHNGLSDLRVVGSMHERKAVMAELSDAFIALPGGYGTLEEFCEVVTWTQLGVHRKSCGLLNVGGFYDPLIAQFDRGVGEGFIKIGNRRIVVAHADPGALLDALAQAPAPPEAPWISGPDET